MGELAALTTALLWSFTSVFFTIAGRRVGSVIVNRTRLVFAVIFLTATHTALYGFPVPQGAESYRWLWLGLSGVVGLVLGDAMLFQALVLIGTRLSMLIMALVPVISTLLAWLFLGERLSILEVTAMALTIGGTSWVVLEGRSTTVGGDRKSFGLGILVALGGALGQALGLITAKIGLVGDFPPLSAVVIRMLTAVSVLWIWTTLRGRVRETVSAWRDWVGLRAIIGGSIVGPFLGVWLSLIAIDTTRVGIASTLMALTPVLVLPLVRIVFQERLRWRAVLGTFVALVGVAMIFLL